MSPQRERPEITLVVDGVEVRAQEGSMLVDAAKRGDVEIPVFCYEPKLGPPVGACRMCLVEIEGIPKLQTACSTAVRDGMVVYTRTDRVIEAQNAVVEFLLVNHPLDCPVCDKGGECPLQDIAMGWGPGKSRFTDPKRHFQKPVPLSPLVRIDRERCILCYRCVRFSQEVAEDEQLQLLERGSSSFVGTFDDRPYIAPFHGNIIELCPVGALTSEAYRFRARPWDIEDAGSVCMLCPSQCNVRFTVRDERIKRVLARDNPAVDDGWLCDKGRFGFQMAESPERILEPRVRAGGELRPASWEEALEAAAAGLRAASGRTAALVGGTATNEEGYLIQRIVRGALASADVESRPGAGAPREALVAAGVPGRAAATADIDSAEAVLVVGCDPLHAMPILDLRLRKAIRHGGVRLAVASDRPTALDGGAEHVARYEPGAAVDFLASLAAALGGGEGASHEAAQTAATLRPGATVIVWSERLADGERGADAIAALLECAERGDARLLEVPATTNGRGLREVGCVAGSGPGYRALEGGRDAPGIRAALEGGDLDAVVLFEADPVRDFAGGPAWEDALRTSFVVAVAAFEGAATAQADVVLPAEGYGEKEGTVTHPDGRLQRLRPAVPHPGRVRAMWQVLAELAALLGEETGLDSAPEVLAAIAEEVPFYKGLTHEEIGGRGVRWQEREAAGRFPEVTGLGPRAAAAPARAPADEGALRLGTYRDLWAAEVTERAPALRFLVPRQTLEVSPGDAERLGLKGGDEVEVRSNGTSVRARVALRDRIRPGSCFLIEGIAGDGANALRAGEPVAVSPAAVAAEAAR